MRTRACAPLGHGPAQVADRASLACAATSVAGGGPGDAAVEAALGDNRETLRALFPLPAPNDASRPHDPARGDGHKGRRDRAAAVIRAGSALTLFAALAFGVLWLDPAYRTEQHMSGIGERSTVSLADGSRVTLDTASRLDVAWHLRSRRARLLQGQAQFEVAAVAQDPMARPFEVTAATTRVRVLGTVFGVRLQDEEVSVTVLEGRVLVDRLDEAGWTDAAATGNHRVDAARAVLGPDERVHAGGDGALGEVQRVDAAAASAWREGRLVFDRTPLVDALAEVQRYRTARIRLHDDLRAPRIAGLQLSGVFETARTDQWLDLLPKVLRVSVTRAADGSVDVQPK